MKEALNHILKLITNMIDTIFRKLNSLFNMSNVWELVPSKIALYNLKSVSIPVFIGIILNLLSENKMPYFFALLFILLFCIFSACYTTTTIKNTYNRLERCMPGDSTLLVLRTKYSSRLHNNIIFMPLVFFGTLIPIATFSLIEINLSISIKIYCFLGLSITVMSCTFGAIHYLLLVLFMNDIRKNINKINKYDCLNPQQTSWFKELTHVSQICNNFFLLVGFMLILAFCIFSFSGRFGIDITKLSSIIYLAIFWIVIVAFIILGSIIMTILSNYETNRILNGLYIREQNKLRENYEHAKDTYVKNTYAIQLSLLSINRSTKTLLKKNFLSYLLSAIDTVASVEATITLINFIINSNIPSLLKGVI